MTLNDSERSKRTCNHRLPKSNLLEAQRSAYVSATYPIVLCNCNCQYSEKICGGTILKNDIQKPVSSTKVSCFVAI